MPELPEVETIADQLNLHLVGKKIVDVTVLNDKSFDQGDFDIISDVIDSVYRRAKTLVFVLRSGSYMLAHLKMTGQMIYQENGARITGGHPSHDFHAELPNKHTRVVIDFDDHSTLYFNDLRKFGWIRVIDKNTAASYFERFGPDAVPTIDLEYLQTRAQRMPRSTVKKFILDQNVISGVGNIYADEALFEAKIHPETLVSQLNVDDWKTLGTAIVEKLQFAISKGGTTDSDYVNALGEQGGMQDYLNVYHKTGTSCPRKCGGEITRIKVAGRGTHYCPVCQKVKK